MNEWVYEKDSLPTGWVRTSMENVSVNDKYSIRMGPFGSQLKKHELVDSGIRVLWIENIVNNKFENKKEKFITNEKYETLKGFSVKPNDVLITMMGTIGRTCVVPPDIGKTIISSHLLKITPHIDLIDSIFLTYLVRGDPQILKQIESKSQGVVMKGLNTKIIKSLEFSLPPLNEQKLIVAKIESIFTQIDAVKKSLIKVECLCRQYKQSVLKNAFNGELTKKWRCQNKDNLEIKKQPLKQIYQELKIMTKNQFKILGTLHKNNLYKIPEDWIWARLANIAQIGQGGTPSTQNREFWNGNIPWLRSGEIRNNFIENTDNFITEKGLQSSSATLCPPGTILLAMTGQGLTRGRSAILKLNACANQSVAHMILDNTRIIDKFLFHYLQSQYWKVRGVSKGSNQSGLNVSLIKQFEIPIPTLLEQKYIVFTLESIFGNIDSIEKQVNAAIRFL